MPVTLSVDGGGSKLSAILFDEHFRLLGRGMSGGVNLTQTTQENAKANVRDCLDQVFSSGTPEAIDRLHIVFVGQVSCLYEELEARTQVLSKNQLSEPDAGLLAGALCDEGILALAGTGSDIFYIRRGDTVHTKVGAWGPIIGDDGSGAWIGQRAIRAVVAGIEGWAPKTILHDLIRRDWNLSKDWDMVDIVHGSAAPFRKVASLTPLVGEAADAGDAVATSIVREAGEIMALQTHCLIDRERIPDEYRNVVCCGGAWKTHPLMFNTFKARLLTHYPGISVEKPWFEHVMAGAAKEALEQGISISEARALLEEKFPDYKIRW